MRLVTARDSAELGKVAFGFAMQGLWLGNRKVGSQEIGEDRNRLPGRETVEKVRRGGRRKEPATERRRKRVHRFRVGLRLETSKSPTIPQPWLGDD